MTLVRLYRQDLGAAALDQLDDALARLAEHDPRLAQIVELRFFGGMTVEEVGAALGISGRTVDRSWRAARAWLRRALRTEEESRGS